MDFFKVLVIGETNVGKTSLTNRIVHNIFNPRYNATIGCEFALKMVEYKGETVKLQLWDLAGQDKLGGVSRLYCRDASAAILVADITCMETLRRAFAWKDMVDEAIGLPTGKIPMVLCLNKCDRTDRIAIDITEAEELAKEQQIPAVFPTSAKDSINLNEVITSIVHNIRASNQLSVSQKGIDLNRTLVLPKKRTCCSS